MTKIQVRRGTAAQWASAATVLAAGEPGWDSTNNIHKVGDGVTAWASLPVVNNGIYASKAGPNVFTGTQDFTGATVTGVTGGGGAAALLDRGNWATSTVYAVGDVTTQTGQRYACATAHTSGTFATDLAASKWVALDTVQAIASGAAAGGDLSGTLPSPTVARINGVAVTGTPTSGQVPTATSGSTATWQTPGDRLGLIPTAAKTTTYTAAAGDFVPVDTTSGSVTVTLPTAPTDGSVIAVKHVTRGSTNTVTVACGGSDVFNKSGGSTTGTLTLANQGLLIQYKATGAIWYVVADDLSLSGLDARYTQVSNNLSDVTAASARTNLGLGSLATLSAFGPAFGDGSDGTATISSTTTLTRDTFYQDLTVTGSGIVNLSGYRLFVKGTLTINANGRVHNDGSTGSGGLHDIGGAAGSSGSFQGGGNGASSGTGAGSTGAVPGSGGYPGAAGTGGGGAGGTGASGAAGAGGATPTLFVTTGLGAGFPAFVGLSFSGVGINRNGTPVVPCGGSGGGSGGGDGTNKGGAGGGGAGICMVNARVIANAGSISANGGAGLQGVAGNAGGGGGGAGGVVVVNTLSLTGAGTITASGGTPGALIGTGTIGTVGQSGFVFQAIWS